MEFGQELLNELHERVNSYPQVLVKLEMNPESKYLKRFRKKCGSYVSIKFNSDLSLGVVVAHYSDGETKLITSNGNCLYLTQISNSLYSFGGRVELMKELDNGFKINWEL